MCYNRELHIYQCARSAIIVSELECSISSREWAMKLYPLLGWKGCRRKRVILNGLFASWSLLWHRNMVFPWYFGLIIRRLCFLGPFNLDMPIWHQSFSPNTPSLWNFFMSLSAELSSLVLGSTSESFLISLPYECYFAVLFYYPILYQIFTLICPSWDCNVWIYIADVVIAGYDCLMFCYNSNHMWFWIKWKLSIKTFCPQGIQILNVLLITVCKTFRKIYGNTFRKKIKLLLP